MPIRTILLSLFSAASPLAAGAAQQAPVSPADRLAQVETLADSAVLTANVTAPLVLRRDAAGLVFESGTFYVLPPVAGRTAAVAFQGRARFTLAPAEPVEQQRLLAQFDSTALDAPLSQAVLVFGDSTFEELQAALRFAPAHDLPGGLRGRYRQMLEWLRAREGKRESLDPDFFRMFLDGRGRGEFFAQLARQDGDPLLFSRVPEQVEGVILSHRVRLWGTEVTDVLTRFRALGDTAASTAERWRQLEVAHYGLEVALPRSAAGEVSFSARGDVTLRARGAVEQWAAFRLFDKLQVDSAAWDDGTRATVWKAEDSPFLWVRLDRPMADGETRTLRIAYHGDLIDRYADLYFIKSSGLWYPRPLDARSRATFDLTYLTPASLRLVSIGERTDSAALPDRMVRTRWEARTPIRNASFNLGLFDRLDVGEEGAPPVAVLYSDQAHRLLARAAMDRAQAAAEQGAAVAPVIPKAFAKDEVGADVANALKFFTASFGPLPARQFWATEIPYGHGEAFPGLIHLSLGTFVETSRHGNHELFRAHEVAHQWWGIGVDYASYRDRWLSEGFSDFAGLWYVQTVRKRNKEYFEILEKWKEEALRRREDRLPIWLGHRAASADRGWDYSAIVYQKGAWVLHMLRIMMLDLRTMNEDQFTATLREFYQSYRGGSASTADFRRVVERRMGMDMGWFFDQWIHRGEIPTYRVAHRIEEAGPKWRVKLRVTQERVPADFQMYVPVAVELDGGGMARLRVKVTGAVTEVDLPLMPARPRNVRFNDLEGVLAEVKTESW